MDPESLELENLKLRAALKVMKRMLDRIVGGEEIGVATREALWHLNELIEDLDT